jgi:hypothetical protein
VYSTDPEIRALVEAGARLLLRHYPELDTDAIDVAWEEGDRPTPRCIYIGSLDLDAIEPEVILVAEGSR